MDLLFLVFLLAVFGYWWDTTRTTELALRHCRQLCQRSEVQLLDSSIVLQRVWLRRAGSGLQLCRLYTFEFSGDGHSRRQGYILLIGHRVVEHHMDPWPVE